MTFEFSKFTGSSRGLLQIKLEELRDQLRSEDPEQLAIRVGGRYLLPENSECKIIIKMWGEDISFTYPEIVPLYEDSGETLDVASQALIYYYLQRTDGTALQNEWVSFSELPNGRFYSQAFQGYSGDVIGRHFRDNLGKFESASKKLGGKEYPLGNAAFIFELFPYVKIMIVAWLGDEDFPTKYQLLFNANTPHHLPTDACAIAGSMLVKRLKRA